MTIVPIAEAQSRLPDLIAGLQPGEEVVIDAAGEHVAKIVRTPRDSWPCQAGSAKHLPHWIAPDFNGPLDDFAEYV